MIIVKQKPLDKILEMTKNFNNILIAGCAGCTSIHQLSGKKEAEIMKAHLERESEKKVKVVFLARQCVRQIVDKSLRPLIRDFDAVLCMGCGVGVQTIAEVFRDKPAFPANDTEFIGMEDRSQGRLYERCHACGNCILDQFCGICPITRCAKGLLNGPCGGQVEGKCEVGGYVNDCVWILIWERLKRQGRLDLFTKFRPHRTRRHSPRELQSTVTLGKS